MESDMFHINTKFLQRLRQASRWFVLLLLACLAGGASHAQTLSFTPGMVSALTSTNSTTGSAAANYTGPLSGLIVNQPQALTFDSQGDLFIVDTGANVVRVVAGPSGKPIPSLPLPSGQSPTPGTVYTVAGNGSHTPLSSPLCGTPGNTTDERSPIDNQFYGNGCPATQAILFLQTPNAYTNQAITSTSAGREFATPLSQVALDASGNLYIADAGDNQVRVVYASGTVPGLLASLPSGVTPIVGNIYAFAGSPINQSTNDYYSCGPNNCQNYAPTGVAVDASGDVYMLFYGNSDIASTLQVVYNGGDLPPILAGESLTVGQSYGLLNSITGSAPYSPPWGSAPSSIALDSSGNIYISDPNSGTNSVYVIYAGGTVPGLSATLQGQAPVVGNTYLFAGGGSTTSTYVPSVPATQATTKNPTQLAIDAAGDSYVGLFSSNLKKVSYIAKVDTSGNLTLAAGNLNVSSSQQVVCAAALDGFGDGCAADQVTVKIPSGIAVAPDGSVYFTDAAGQAKSYTFALRKIDGSTSAQQFPTESAGVASPAQVVTVSNVDTQPLNLSAIDFPNNFIQVPSGGTDCSASTTLTAGQSCLVGIQFQAVQAGPFSGNVAITSDSTNAASAVNSIAVSGTATAATGTSAQTINFTAPSTATYGQTIALAATATSGLAVLYQVTSGPGIINGNTLTVTSGVGTIIVTAYQPGDNGDSGNSAGWAAATPVQATITAQPALLTVTAGSISQARTLPIPSLASDYTITVTINGVTSPTPASATTGFPTLTTSATETSPAGPYPIVITPGTLTSTTSNYSLTTASYVNGTFTVLPGLPQTVAFTQTLPTVTYGVAPIDLTGTATASSALPVTYAVMTGPATIGGANGATLTITGVGTVVVAANQVGNSNYAPAPPVTQSFLVNPATVILAANNLHMAQGSTPPPLTYTVGGLVSPDTAAAVVSGAPALATTATSSSPAGTTYPITIAQGKVTLLSKNYTLTSASYVPGTMSVVVGTPQTITFGALPNVTYGVATLVLSASASSGLPVTFSVSSGPASITGSVLSVTGAGTVAVTANQGGNATYSPAPPASQSFTVAQAALSIVANSMTIADNIPIPPLTFTVTGLVNGDTPAVLSEAPAISTTATAGSPAGTYPITVGPLGNFGDAITATSYTINAFVPGTLTITSGGPVPNFTPTLSTPTLTILNGQVGQTTITVNPLNYYSGTLNLSCTGLPANVSCVFSPPSLSVPAKLTATLTISTSSATVVGSLSPAGSNIYRAAIAGWVSLLFGLVLAWQRKRLARYKTMWVFALAVCLGCMAASLTACGGSSSSSSSSKGLAVPGTSTIQVVAADANGGPTYNIPLVVTIR